MTYLAAQFGVSNVVIALGYLFFAVFVIRLLPVRRRTTVAGVAFFALCALTHLDMDYHLIWEPTEGMGESAPQLHMQLIHVPQAFAIWAFVLFFFADMKRLATDRGTTDPPEKP